MLFIHVSLLYIHNSTTRCLRSIFNSNFNKGISIYYCIQLIFISMKCLDLVCTIFAIIWANNKRLDEDLITF